LPWNWDEGTWDKAFFAALALMVMFT
jgi:hypothetical protein